MNYIDTHCHLYLEEFAPDREAVIQRASDAGVNKILLPNIDSASWQPMLELSRQQQGLCLPMAGIHPGSVAPETIEKELAELNWQLENNTFVAIGEIGIDLYWDKTHQGLQEEIFRYQIQLAKKHNLPVAIHVRKSFEEVWKILKPETGAGLRGVFHCFSGDEAQARKVTEAGFFLGIGGVVSFKNAGLQQVVSSVGIDFLVLETDAPFLAPVPWRGKRNEPAYLSTIASKLADLLQISIEEAGRITSKNASALFGL